MIRFSSIDTTGQRHWPVVLLLLTVLFSSASVLWLTNAAVRNERAAVRQRLTEAYHSRLRLAESCVEEYWRSIDAEIEQLAAKNSGPELFKACVAADLADSILIVDSGGAITYPAPSVHIEIASLNPKAWAAANQLEFRDHSIADATEAYAAIATTEPQPNAEARAWMAHARCLEKGGQRDQAISILTNELGQPGIAAALDQDGRSVRLDALLRATQLVAAADGQASRLETLQESLQQLLNDYGNKVPSAQRQFAMRAFRELFPESPEFETFSAEQLAANHFDSPQSKHGILWKREQRDSGVILLFRNENVITTVEELIAEWSTSDERIVASLETDSEVANADVATRPLHSMPDWNLSVQLNDPSLFEDASRHQTALYSLAALLSIAAVAVGVAVTGIFVRRQLKLAQMKNDLAAVVTHELRTPLASIRVLVDTLLDDSTTNASRTKEYLKLIAQENERLSRLIDNFLTFSRLERNQQRFDFRASDPANLADQAVVAINGKLNDASCVFERELQPGLPSVHVDPDAIVTVLLNLLDNAVKFTGDEKRIELRISRDEQFVRFEIEDNGIGMSATDARNAFERFYQADTRLSRSHGGCGLGLSLVRSIVDAHNGSVAIASKSGVGSTFTVRLPFDNANEVV
ncbi:MAG: HAMP domain-containing histidine kinase [Planctomycetes bacterium]|nr:HAMP domain-containing histidine kinase [Planctomycetota bacterium]